MKTYSLERAGEFIRRYWLEDASVPKHEQLRRALTQSIVEGFWAVGGRLPTEAELVAASPCSLGTVQRALRDLASEGIIERRRGSGTVVSDLNTPTELPLHMRFFKAGGERSAHLPLSTEVVGRRLLKSTGPWTTALSPGATVVKIDRVFFIDGRLRVYSSFYANAAQFPELVSLPKAALTNRDFKRFMVYRYHTSVHEVRQKLRYEVPPARVVRHGDCAAGIPAAVLNVVAYALNDDALYYQDFYLPPSELVLDLGMARRR